MQFSGGLLSPVLAWACVVAAALLLVLALGGLPALRAGPSRIHLLLGAAVGLAVLWSVNAGIDPGLRVHVLGMTVVVLLLGWRLGVLAGALAEISLVAYGVTPLMAAAAAWLVCAAIPGAVTLGIAWTARFYLPRNPFVFIFVCGFFGAGLAVLATWLTGAALLALSGQPSPSGAGASLTAFLPLMLFPEAFINGALVSMLIVYRPEWLRLYDEAFYARD